MSRVGKKLIQIPHDVRVVVENREVKFEGPKGILSFMIVNGIDVILKDGFLSVVPVNNSKKVRSAWGMLRTMLSNCLCGVTKGYERKLELNGVGYRCSMVENGLKINLGFSHEVIYYPPEGISLSVSKPTEVVVSGIEKQKVGHVAAQIRAYRVAEPYKGRGIKYNDEVIVRKEGKKK
ncbi:MAG: 50S ribosomal protein L6 [Candidatus Liberibacter europaeus]|uniref:50S ribosomal protein L6 n=1 Tax=Candidatus Liberibacter europaeus TaxID=744859 RepID=A0A2T4VY44_9HYPH|nr:50S ribosomal protein L6 [Candidatus Liberibacter europaeus]PTL86694.1 MAG: 50S ribosomal protein L6 [Candidatus Liberibacter europaeus]